MPVIVSSEILLIFLSRFCAYFYCNFYVTVKFNIELYISYYLFYYDFLIYNRDKTTRYSGRDFQGGPTRLSQKRIPTRNVFAALTFLSSQKIPGFNTRLIFCIMKYKKKLRFWRPSSGAVIILFDMGHFPLGFQRKKTTAWKAVDIKGKSRFR